MYFLQLYKFEVWFVEVWAISKSLPLQDWCFGSVCSYRKLQIVLFDCCVMFLCLSEISFDFNEHSSVFPKHKNGLTLSGISKVFIFVVVGIPCCWLVGNFFNAETWIMFGSSTFWQCGILVNSSISVCWTCAFSKLEVT